MKKHLSAVLALAAVALVGVASAMASGATVTQGSATDEPWLNQCNDETILVSYRFTDVQRGGDLYSFTSTIEGRGVGQATGAIYVVSGTLVWVPGSTTNYENGAITFMQRGTIRFVVVEGPAPGFTSTFVYNVTVTPDGTVRRELLSDDYTCLG
jgi:hypothetical protein